METAASKSGPDAQATAQHLTSTTSLPAPFPASEASSAKPVMAGLLLVVLAAVALVMARRRKRTPRLVEIVESSSLGPKRSLVVARMGDELLLLGASEGGISLLATRPAPPAPPDAAVAAARSEPALAPLHARDGAAAAQGPVPASRFELILGESAEDVELRRKLAAGSAGSIR